MSKERVEQAAERLRSYYETEIRCSPILVLSDCEELAKTYLSEHLVDDDELVTAEWFNHAWIENGENRLCVSFHPVDKVIDIHIQGEFPSDAGIVMSNIKTRGDVRRLCAVLGIEWKEGA